MMSDEKNPGLFTTSPPPVRMVFPHLFTPRTFKPGDKPKYDAMFLWPNDHPDLVLIRKLVAKIAKDTYPAEFAAVQAAIKEGRPYEHILAFPFKSGERVAMDLRAKPKYADRDYTYFDGVTTITARSQYEPILSVLQSGRAVRYTDEMRVTAKDKYFYPGVLVAAELNFGPYTQDGGGRNKGVTCYLNRVMSTGKGERLGGGGKADDEVFSQYLGAVSAENPLDDDIPF